jgi:hypothetical protein
VVPVADEEDSDPDAEFYFDDPTELAVALQQNLAGVLSADVELQYNCTMNFRKILSKG